MYEVECIFDGKTSVWMTNDVVDAILSHDGLGEASEMADGNKGLFKKIEYWSKAGFRNFEGSKRPIKHEGNGVYRIGYGDLFRVYGFYSDDIRKIVFIAVEPHADKKGKKNTSRERAIIQQVAEAKKHGQWKEKDKSS